jgi:hypothetical protein
LECSEKVNELTGTNENVNRCTVNRPLQGNLIRNIGLHQMIIFSPDITVQFVQCRQRSLDTFVATRVWTNAK